MVKNGRGQVSKELVYTLIFLALLVTMIIVVAIFADKGGALLDTVKRVLRFGR